MAPTELAHLHRINEAGNVEAVDLVKTSQKNADGFYLLRTMYMRAIFRPEIEPPPQRIPVKIVLKGEVFKGEPTLEYTNKIIADWSESFLPLK